MPIMTALIIHIVIIAISIIMMIIMIIMSIMMVVMIIILIMFHLSVLAFLQSVSCKFLMVCMYVYMYTVNTTSSTTKYTG